MHDFTPFYTPFALGLMPIILLVALWTVVLKGFALWHAARGGQKGWYIALLIVNTLGILEIIYLIWFRPKSEALAIENNTPINLSSSAE